MNSAQAKRFRIAQLESAVVIDDGGPAKRPGNRVAGDPTPKRARTARNRNSKRANAA